MKLSESRRNELAERDRRVRLAAKSGATPVADIAKRFGITTVTVNEILAGRELAPAEQDFTERNKAIQQAYLSGRKVKDIAAQFGLSRSYVQKLVNPFTRIL